MRLVRPSAHELEALFGPATRSIWICSPWITTDGARLLGSALSRCTLNRLVAVEIWMRIEEEERAAGFNDYVAVDALLRRLDVEAPSARVTLWSASQLHAKVIWTDQGALIGSANLTGAGFGSNVELAARLEPSECAAQLSIRELLRVDMTEVSRPSWAAFMGEPPSGNQPPAQPQAGLASESQWESFHERLLADLRRGGIRG
ncbi:phospholipase D-like domain-containing protein [Polyangium sorediatum]|uniref:Phospholipase D-like domain-containing protein n=1 Tax=Polyangium sorediatum TaxID=889274 RepID=A0ABT6P916_9BACT|nr:phospholipase D-like domain-containing protein [Polyangium sorediatum]MDI1437115.1 phospholipase D-like domain-containing protein [Polyangium sorediatum]